LLAASLNLVGLTFEALQWQPRGVGVGMVLHGFYWLLIGYLIFRSTFLPRILGALMAFAGFGWLTYSIPAARELSVPLQSDLRPPRGRIGDAVAPCIRSERTAMEGAGRHSGGMAIAARSAPLIPSPRVRKNDCEHSCNDATDWRNIATSQGENYRCVLSPHHNQRSWGYLSNGAEAIEVTSTWLLPW
jgi:hypothetical protein